jgi:hypothetical protein
MYLDQLLRTERRLQGWMFVFWLSTVVTIGIMQFGLTVRLRQITDQLIEVQHTVSVEQCLR